MTVATLERNNVEIELPLLEEGRGSPLVALDVSKPEAGPTSVGGSLHPRWQDFYSQMETYTLAVRFVEDDAHSKAADLADLILSHSDGNPLLLNIDLPEYDSDIEVAPAAEQEQAAAIAYDVGQRNFVDVELSLTRVEQTLGAGTQNAVTPTAVGDGPITLSSGEESVEFTAGVVVDRVVGRPNSVIRRSTGEYPNYIDYLRVAHDAFEIAAEFTTDAANRAQTLTNMVGQPLGRSALTLDFNGVYGLGAFDVVGSGSQSVRTVRNSAEQGVVVVPSINLRRVLV